MSYSVGRGWSAKRTPYGGARGRAAAYMASAGTKRGASYTAKRFPRAYAKPVASRRSKPSLSTRVRALIAGKTKDSITTVRTAAHNGTTQVSCLTSNTDFAAATLGLLVGDADTAMLNSVTVRERFTLTCLEDLTPVGLSECIIRTLIIWYYKPLLVASAAGTMPPVTEVLESDSIESLYVSETRNSGRFTVLLDKSVNLGCNTVAVAASGADARVNGQNVHFLEYTLPINKTIHFKESPEADAGAASNAGGHYDSDNAAGQVDKGLLVMYTLALNPTSAGTCTITRSTRVNYTM